MAESTTISQYSSRRDQASAVRSCDMAHHLRVSREGGVFCRKYGKNVLT
jgi:hypothetical protein